MTRRIRRLSAALFSVVCARAELQRFEAVEPHMGTLFKVTVYAESAERARVGFQAAFARARELDERLSDYKIDSELNRLCRAGSARVSGDLATILRHAARISRRSEGAFDATAGPLVRLWREARRSGMPPHPASIEAARQLMDWRGVRVESDGTVRLPGPNMQLDLGGIAKGFAADEMLRALERLRIRMALVAASGDLVAGRAPPGTKGWRIAIEGLPDPVLLERAAVSTSGDGEQGFEAGGVRYSHIVDPRTGQALRDSAAVTVIAPEGWRADALATALSVTGPAGWKPVRGVRAIFHPRSK